MIPSFNNAIQALLQVVRRANAAGEPLYLVGGAVRDLLCQRDIKDLDFVTAGNTQQISWAVKRLLNARAFILDDERQTARVIHTLPNRQTILLDFVRFTGETLGEDLRARDFTINAMALDVNQPDQLIDPLGGQQDLQKGFLRVASEESMRLDPLRVMRGVRMALDYGLQLDPYTETLMKASGADLAKVSAERQRDELFKLLSLPQPQRAISRLHDLDALPALLPELCALKRVPVSAPHVHPLWQHTLQVVSYLDQLLDALLNPNSPAHLTAYFQDFLTAIAPYRPELVSHLQKAIQEERSRLSLLLFAALYHDAGKPEAMKLGLDRRLHFHGHADGSQEAVIYRACQLALSNNEVKYLACLTQHHMRIHHLASKALPPSKRAIYRYFRDTGGCGLDIGFLSLADLLATYEDTLTPAQWQAELSVVLSLFQAWWACKEEVVSPPKLLDGHDLQAIFNLQPGPQLAKILEALKETQADGQVSDKAGAIEFVRQYLKDNPDPHDAGKG